MLQGQLRQPATSGDPGHHPQDSNISSLVFFSTSLGSCARAGVGNFKVKVHLQEQVIQLYSTPPV